MFSPVPYTHSCKTEVGNSSDLVLSWRYSTDSDDDLSISSVDTSDNDAVTKENDLIQCPSCPISGSSTRNSSFSLQSTADVSSISSSGSSVADLSSVTNDNYTPSRRIVSNKHIDGSCGIAHASRDVSPMSTSANSTNSMSSVSPIRKVSYSTDFRLHVGAPSPPHNGASFPTRDASPGAAVRADCSFQRRIEHDLLQQKDQLVLLTKDARVPHVHIQVENKTADELVAHSTAVLRTTRTGQAVLRRNYGVQGAPSPTGARLRAPFAVYGNQRRGSTGSTGVAGSASCAGSAGGGTQDSGYGATVRNLERSGVAFDKVIDSIEAYLGGLGACTTQSFAKPTMGNMLTTVVHRKY